MANNGNGCIESYDRYGNRWSQQPYGTGNSCGGSSLSFTGSNNRIDGYSYDAAGNLLNDGLGHTYTYDAEGHIVNVGGSSTATYVYDAEGRRVRRVTSTGTSDYLYDVGGHAILELNGTGAAVLGEVYSASRHLASYQNGATFFAHTDWLSNERARSQMNGTVYSTWTNLPFGEGSSAPNPGPLHFTGKERDTVSNLDYFGARYDASSLGRFMSPDPLMASAHTSNPQTWNRYSYALNNPLRITDPEGLYPSPAYKCDKDHKECLNDAQRALLEKSVITDKNGNKLSGEKLWNSLSEKQQNAFVNITDRLASIKLSDGSTALSKVNSLTSIETDRIKATVDPGLANLIKNDARFHTVSGSLHPGYDEVSYKSKENVLNVQFSFGQGGKAADIDQDLYQDIRHWGEVIANHVTGSTTNQDSVRKMMMARPDIAITPSTDPKWNRPQQQ